MRATWETLLTIHPALLEQYDGYKQELIRRGYLQHLDRPRDGGTDIYFTDRWDPSRNEDTAALSNSGKIITMVMMFIGGSPGSTAGGVKTTSVIVLLFYAGAMVLNKEDINLFGRRLTDEVVKKANAVVIINATLTIVATVIIMALQPLLNFEDVLFEVLSAIGTVGMTVGITRDLDIIARVILIVLMYCGRLGSLSFALVFAQKNTSTPVRQPQEKIIVG